MSKPRYELWGESLRELGVLVLVFVPLDVLVEYSSKGFQLDQRHWFVILTFVVLGIVLMALGVEIERR